MLPAFLTPLMIDESSASTVLDIPLRPNTIHSRSITSRRAPADRRAEGNVGRSTLTVPGHFRQIETHNLMVPGSNPAPAT